MTNPLEHDSNEDALLPVKGKRPPEEKEPGRLELRREQMKEKRGPKPWLRMENPDVWDKGSFDDDDDVPTAQALRYRALKTN